VALPASDVPPACRGNNAIVIAGCLTLTAALQAQAPVKVHTTIAVTFNLGMDENVLPYHQASNAARFGMQS
jgi:hypothetical protein